MYLVAFIALVVAIMGTFAQVYNGQAVQLRAPQRAGAVVEAMMQWHATAVDLAENFIDHSNFVSGGGCSLSCFYDDGAIEGTEAIPGFDIPSSRVAYNVYQCTGHLTLPGIFELYFPPEQIKHACVWPENYWTTLWMSSYPFGHLPAVEECSGRVGAPCFPTLSEGYDMTYTFHSFGFKSVSEDYFVFTFVPPPTRGSDAFGSGLLCLPGNVNPRAVGCPLENKQLSLPFSALYKQMRESPNLSPLSYGLVLTQGVLKTSSIDGLFGSTAPQAITYSVPMIVPTGSVGIITKIKPQL